MARIGKQQIVRDVEIDGHQLARIRRKLLTWFDLHQRDLPWRRTRDPYAVWLSEMMLQQTQVATVIPYYEKFMKRFPTVNALAAADLDVVLQLWAGLGYYARARNLHRAAKIIATELGGVFPTSAKELKTLPGIGAYTAGAVASIAFNEKAPVVDGNVARVVARLFEIEADVRDGAGLDLIWRIAGRLLPNKRCGDFNQSLMELGATVCLPKASARCLTCPLRNECEALASGVVSSLPTRTRKAVNKNETHVVVAIQNHGKWLVVKRPQGGLWGGLWELPTAVLNGERTLTLARRLANDITASSVTIKREPFCTLKHQLTHRTITFVGYLCQSNRPATGGRIEKSAKWLNLSQVGKLGISTAMRNVTQALQKTVKKSNRRTV